MYLEGELNKGHISNLNSIMNEKVNKIQKYIISLNFVTVNPCAQTWGRVANTFISKFTSSFEAQSFFCYLKSIG